MNQNPYGQQNPFSSSTGWTVAESPAEVQSAFILKTYALFFAGILAAVVMGGITLNTPLYDIALMLRQIPLLACGLLIVGGIAAQAVSRIEGLNYAALFGFTSLVGFLLTPIVDRYESMFPGIVAQAGFLTVVIFGALTAYVFVTKKDFSFMGGMLCVGGIGLFIAILANAFWFQSAGIGYWIAWISLFLFSGFVLYDTSQIIHRHDPKSYCAAALDLFIDFYMIFMSLLQILAGSRDD
jgi:FtsH-binding integral membrane protein